MNLREAPLIGERRFSVVGIELCSYAVARGAVTRSVTEGFNGTQNPSDAFGATSPSRGGIQHPYDSPTQKPNSAERRFFFPLIFM